MGGKPPHKKVCEVANATCVWKHMLTGDLILEKEFWKDVVGYEGKYMVSSIGRV